MWSAVVREPPLRGEGAGETGPGNQKGRVPNTCGVRRRGVGLHARVLAVHPRHRGAHGDSDRIRMERNIAERDDVVQRVDDRDRHAALRGADDRTRASVREARHDGHACQREYAYDEPFHGCLTTMTAFMNGCGVQWNAYSPGCVNVCVQVLPGSIGPESQEPSSAVIVWTSGSLLVQRTVVPTAISRRFGPNDMVRTSASVAPSPPSPPPAAASPAAVFPRRPKYRLSVKGIVNSNPPRTRSRPRDTPWSVAVLVLVTCRE